MVGKHLGALALLAGIVACGPADSPPNGGKEAGLGALPRPRAPAPAMSVGQRYPDLHLTDLDGREVTLGALAGDVLLIEPVGMT